MYRRSELPSELEYSHISRDVVSYILNIRKLILGVDVTVAVDGPRLHRRLYRRLDVLSVPSLSYFVGCVVGG